MPDPLLPEFVTPNFAALLLGMAPKYVRYLVGAGLLPASATEGGHLRIALADVERTRNTVPVTMAEFMETKRRYDRGRGSYNRDYNARRKRMTVDDEQY